MHNDVHTCIADSGVDETISCGVYFGGCTKKICNNCVNHIKRYSQLKRSGGAGLNVLG